MDCIAKDISKAKSAELLMDYCAGTLAPAETAELEDHMRGCAECRELVDAQQSLWQTLDTWKPMEVSADFDAKLYGKISQHEAEPWYKRGYKRLWQFPTPLSFWKPALSIGVVAAVLAVVAVVRTPNT